MTFSTIDFANDAIDAAIVDWPEKDVGVWFAAGDSPEVDSWLYVRFRQGADEEFSDMIGPDIQIGHTGAKRKRGLMSLFWPDILNARPHMFTMLGEGSHGLRERCLKIVSKVARDLREVRR